LKALIDTAHMRGIMVFLDVVYSHFGPEGNMLARIAPAFFSAVQTSCGAAIDYRVAEVHAFAIDNTLHWLEHYRFDGFRIDAVHALSAPGEPHFLAELAVAVDAFATASGRHIHLVLEDDDNTARFLAPAGGYRAQWNDDYHTAWHVLLTAENTGYYRDFQDVPAHIARAISEGFAYQSESHSFADVGAVSRAATCPASISPTSCRAMTRSATGLWASGWLLWRSGSRWKPRFSCSMLQPGPPLMFMGDEWSARANPSISSAIFLAR
jgi:maltooligosyltrehalose trehalohydrolase